VSRCRLRADEHIAHNKKPRRISSTGLFRILAERVGFEPTVRGNRTPDFESGTFDHSATSPGYCFLTASPALVGDRRSEHYRTFFDFFKPSFEQISRSGKFASPEQQRGAFQDAASRRATPPMYGRSASGTITEPSAFWKFSSTATSVRPTASPEPLSVCTRSGLPCALR
jgi:hypothetical protein